jgi:hypothetical protein
VISLAVGEKILASTVVGLLFIVAGIVLQKLKWRRQSYTGAPLAT